MADLTILEPVSTGDIIDRAIRLYRRNFTPLISIVAVPTLIYYVFSMMIWMSYSHLLLGGAEGFNAADLLMIMGGMVGMLVWLVMLMLTVAGLSRVIGDNIMTGEPITFRRCMRFGWSRIGDVLLMGLLTIVLAGVLYFVIVIALFVMLLALGIGMAAGTAVGVPSSAGGVLAVIGVIVGGIGIAILFLSILARIAFVPQSIMIEGQSAGSAIGRAFRLGAKNWYKVAAIALFNYFVKISILAAIVFPVGMFLYLSGNLAADTIIKPGWNALYTAADQLSGLLVMPIWITSFTLLYFDSRVRKEGYDIEILSLGLQPVPQAAYWRGPAPYLAVPQPAYPAANRYGQMTVLGLSGPSPLQSGPPQTPLMAPPIPPMPGTLASGSVNQFPPPPVVPPMPPVIARSGPGPYYSPPPPPNAGGGIVCASCGRVPSPGARFCINCGAKLPTVQPPVPGSDPGPNTSQQ